MDIDAVIDGQGWDAYPRPPYYSPTALYAALRSISTADSERAAACAAAELQDAVGNGHSGALYPVAAPAVAVLLAVVERWQKQGREQALVSLAEILEFEALPDYEICAVDGRRIDIEQETRDRLRHGLPILQRIASDKQPWQHNRKLAISIIDTISEDK